MPSESPLPFVMTVSEVAEILKISRWSVYKCVKSGELRALRRGRSVRVTQLALLEFSGDKSTVEA